MIPRLRGMGNERFTHPVPGNTTHAQRPDTGVRTSGLVSVSLCLHHIHTRYVHLARLVGRRLPANTTLLQHDARTLRCRSCRCHTRTLRRGCTQAPAKQFHTCHPLPTDWMSMDGKWRNPNAQEERINVPANPRHYLALAYAPDAGTTDEAESLNEKIKELIAQTGR